MAAAKTEGTVVPFVAMLTNVAQVVKIKPHHTLCVLTLSTTMLPIRPCTLTQLCKTVQTPEHTCLVPATLAKGWRWFLQVAGSCQAEEAQPDSPDAHLHMDWPAGPAVDSDQPANSDILNSRRSSQDADSSHLSTSFPPNLPGLLTTHTRSGSEELNLHEAESSRASSRIPAHSALSRMLQESNVHEHEEGAAWSLGAGGGTLQAGAWPTLLLLQSSFVTLS